MGQVIGLIGALAARVHQAFPGLRFRAAGGRRTGDCAVRQHQGQQRWQQHQEQPAAQWLARGGMGHAVAPVRRGAWADGSTRQVGAKTDLVEPCVGVQRRGGGGREQAGVEVGTVAFQAEQRQGPARAGQQIDQGQQPQAQSETVAVAQPHRAVHRPGPASRVRIRQCQVGVRAIRPAEPEAAHGAPGSSDGGLARRVPCALQVAAAHRWQRLRGPSTR